MNLFHPYLSNIEGLRNVVSVKPLSYNHHPNYIKHKFHSLFNLDKSNILLTDAITTGSETRKILRGSFFTLKPFGGFTKVCGYLALKSALDELERDFPDITFNFMKIVEDRDQYAEEHKKIIYVYQKRMEPIDEEHPFIVAEIRPGAKLEEIKSIISGIIRKKYGNEFELLDNELGIDSKFNFTIYFDDPERIFKSILKINLQRGDTIEKLAIRFKFSSSDSKLRIMALSMPHLNHETRIQGWSRLFSSKCGRTVPAKRCKGNLLLKILAHLAQSDRCALCAECVDSNASLLLMRDVYSAVSESGLLKVS